MNDTALIVQDAPRSAAEIRASPEYARLEALLDFDGTLIFVSHDRWFVSRLANRIVEISADGSFRYEFKVAPGAQAIVVEAIDSVGNIATSSQIFYGDTIVSRSD